MLILNESDVTFDIYDCAICYMFYRYFKYAVGIILVRIRLPYELDDDLISEIFSALKIGQRRSFDYWSAASSCNRFEIRNLFWTLNSDLEFWSSGFLKHKLMPHYQVRCSLTPPTLPREPLLFARSSDPILERVYVSWSSANFFALKIREILISNSAELGLNPF